jgi:hypothetical protein
VASTTESIGNIAQSANRQQEVSHEVSRLILDLAGEKKEDAKQ